MIKRFEHMNENKDLFRKLMRFGVPKNKDDVDKSDNIDPFEEEEWGEEDATEIISIDAEKY